MMLIRTSKTMGTGGNDSERLRGSCRNTCRERWTSDSLLSSINSRTPWPWGNAQIWSMSIGQPWTDGVNPARPIADSQA